VSLNENSRGLSKRDLALNRALLFLLFAGIAILVSLADRAPMDLESVFPDLNISQKFVYYWQGVIYRFFPGPYLYRILIPYSYWGINQITHLNLITIDLFPKVILLIACQYSLLRYLGNFFEKTAALLGVFLFDSLLGYFLSFIKGPSIIETIDITKVYGMGDISVSALSGVSVQIEAGEFVAIMGPSGSGKSTLMHILGCLSQPTSGQYILDGEDVSNLDKAQLAGVRNRKIGFIFQAYNLIPVLTAFENAELPLLLTGLSRKERHEHVEAVLRLVNLSDRMDHYPSQLSGGQQQRVAIARAIITDPTILVADEPTGDLDRVSAEDILTFISRLNHEFGKTIIMVTHDPRAAEKAHLIRHLEKGVLSDS